MKKIYITIASVWALSAMNAQVLTNGFTKGQLLNTNYFLDASSFQGQADPSNGKLLGFPKTDLTKFKFNLGVVTDEVTLSGFDGVIVYNTVSGKVGQNADGGYTADAMGKQVDVEPGFYYFSNPNGADNQSVTEGKWVRLSDTEVNAKLWAQRQANGITETYLKPALANNDFVGYNSNRIYQLNLGEVTDADGYMAPFLTTGGFSELYKAGKIPYSVSISSDVLPLSGTESGNYLGDIWKQSNFSQFNNILREDFVANSGINWYIGHSLIFTTKDVTTPMTGGIEGVHVRTNHFSNSNLNSLKSIINQATIGDENHNSTVSDVKVSDNRAIVNQGSKAEDVILISGVVQNQGDVDNVKGMRLGVISHYEDKVTDTYPTHTIKSMKGIENIVAVSQNAMVESLITGTDSRVDISENVTMTANKLIYGNYNRIRLGSALSENTVYADRNIFELNVDGAGAKNVYLNQSMISSLGTGTSVAEDVFGFNFRNSNTNNWTANNIYGVYLSSITNGTSGNYGLYIEDIESNTAINNYAIRTGKGDIRFGQLMGNGNRMVVANADGVLSTQALPTPSAPKWVEDPSTNAVTLTVNSNGSPRTSNVVSVYDNGEILANGFKGTNGATIFPDYVFENYYTGTSTAKADYNFANLSQVEDFVKTNGHLPGYVSAKEIKAQGYIDIMDTQLTNVEKIEELYLHTIEQEKKIEQQSKEIEELKSLVKQLLNK